MPATMATNQPSTTPTASQLQSFRAFTILISSTPTDQLPLILTSIQTYISPLVPLLKNPSPIGELSTLFHTLRTRVTSLLTDRSPFGKLSGLIIVSSLLSAAPTTFLSTSGAPWIKHIITIVGRTDSTATKIRGLAIRVATQLLVLAKDEGETVARELATPNVPLLVDAGLKMVEGDKIHWAVDREEMVGFVLEGLEVLVPRHTATMRPFIGRITELVRQVLDIPGHENVKDGQLAVSEEVKVQARTVYVLLHDCATKTGTLPDRNAGCELMLEKLTREVEECFTILFDSDKLDLDRRHVSGANFPPINQIIESLAFMQTYLITPSSKAVSLPVPKVANLLRLISSASISMPPPDLSEITRQDRNRQLLDLPTLHLAALDLATSIIELFKTASLSVSFTLLKATLNTFTNNQHSEPVRTAVYRTLITILTVIGPSLPTNQVKLLFPIIHSLSSDILPQQNAVPSQPVTATSSISTTHKRPTETTPTLSQSFLAQAATSLLPHLLSLPASSLPPSARATLDRTAILSSNAKALVASTLNPQLGRGKSILPLAMGNSEARERLEGVIRPRIPPRSYRPDDEDVEIFGDGDGDKARDLEEEFAEAAVGYENGEEGMHEDLHMEDEHEAENIKAETDSHTTEDDKTEKEDSRIWYDQVKRVQGTDSPDSDPNAELYAPASPSAPKRPFSSVHISNSTAYIESEVKKAKLEAQNLKSRSLVVPSYTSSATVQVGQDEEISEDDISDSEVARMVAGLRGDDEDEDESEEEDDSMEKDEKK